MKLHTVGTGSSGNCYLLQAGNDILLLDAGVKPVQRVSKAMYDLRPARPCGCLVTHEHGDHAAIVKNLSRIGISCLGSHGTAVAVGGGMTEIVPYDPADTHHEVRQLGDSFVVMAFRTFHDAADPCGFLITNRLTGERMIYATDTYSLPFRFPGIHYWLIECNYCNEFVGEDTPPILEKRLKETHMSLDGLCGIFRGNNLADCKKIILCHLSRDRGDPDGMRRKIRAVTGKSVEIAYPGSTHNLSLEPF